jgi:hypothetical protein
VRLKDRRLLILLYVEANPGTLATRILEDIYPDAVRGQNSKRRHAFLEIREMETIGFIRRVGARFFPL